MTATPRAEHKQRSAFRVGILLTTVLLMLCLAKDVASAQVTYLDKALDFGLAGEPGPNGDGIGGGLAWIDYDNDGDLDLAVSTANTPPSLYENQDGVLIEVAFALIPDTPPAECGGVVAFDPDNDGDTDLLLLRIGSNVFMQNDDGVFTDRSTDVLPRLGHWSASAAAGDFDGDGDDDLLIANYIAGVSFPDHQCARSSLLVNDGTGRFIDRTLEYGVLGDGCSLGAAMSDYDRDGDLDLIVINDFGHFSIPNQLYRNDGPGPNGSWLFTDVSVSSGFAYALYGMGLAVSDINDDGWLEYFSTSIGRPALLSSQPNGMFLDQTADFGAGITYEFTGYQLTWSAVFDDFDGDGWLDLVATGGHIPAASFLKNGTNNSNVILAGGPQGFVPDPTGWSLPEPALNSARGMTMGDFNNDNKLDIGIVHSHGMLSIYTPTNDIPIPLRIRPKTTYTGPSAAGLKIEAVCGGTVRTRELTTGGQLGSSSPSEIRLTFPGECGAVGAAIQLTIQWPSGLVEKTTAAMGALLDLEEPQWITLTETSLSVSPTDVSGALITDPNAVNITAEGATITGLTYSGGTFTAEYVADGDVPVRFSLNVNGQPLAVHPTRLWTGLNPRTLRTYPQKLVAGETYTVQAIPRDVDGDPLGSSASVEISVDDTVYNVEADDSGSYELELTAPLEPTELNIQLQVGGLEHGAPIKRQVFQRIDPTQSRLRMGPLHVIPFQENSNILNVYLVARDVNGFALNTNELTYELVVDGQSVEPMSTNYEGVQVLLSYPNAPLVDGSAIQFFADGVEFPGPHTFHILESDDTALSDLDPLKSRCAFSMATISADGIDIGTALIFLRDTHGNPITSSVLPLELSGNQGLTVLQDTLSYQDDRWTFSVRAGTQTGYSTVTVTSGGMPTGIVCVIEAIEPMTTGAGSQSTSTIEIVPNKLPAGSNSTAKVRAYPRTSGGRLIGSSSEISVTAEGAELTDMQYRGIGLYQGDLAPAGSPGLATVTLWDQNIALATATLEIFDPTAPTDVWDTSDSSEADSVDDGSDTSDATNDTVQAPSPTDTSTDAGWDSDGKEADGSAELDSSSSEPIDAMHTDTVFEDSVTADTGKRQEDTNHNVTSDIQTSDTQVDTRMDGQATRTGVDESTMTGNGIAASGGCQNTPIGKPGVPLILVMGLYIIVGRRTRRNEGVIR